jgi:hypothetical protein
MKRTLQFVSKKDFFFGLVILALVVVISLKPSNKVRFTFGEDSVDIKTTKYSMNIPYDMIHTAQLVDKPDMGTEIDGYTDNIIAYGIWENEAWGEYTACIEVYTDNCIVLQLTDGRFFVLSRRDNEETLRIYEQFQLYLK